MSDITVNITTISTSVNVTDNEVSVAVSFIPVDVTLNFEYGVSRAVIDSLLTKENITGLKETDSPEFSSLQSKALQSATNGGQIPDTDYSWFKGLFAGLQDKFIFSWIYGLIMLVKDALTRIGLLEDKYILRYVVPVDTYSIDLTTDKYGNAFNFVEGDIIEIYINLNLVEASGSPTIRLNSINRYVYLTAIASFFPITTAVSNMVKLIGKIDISIVNGEASIVCNTEYSYSNNTHGGLIVIGRTNVANLTSINTIGFGKISGIIAGSTIVIKRK